MKIKNCIKFIFFAVFVNNALAFEKYTITKIDLGGNESFAFDINDNGMVVGRAKTALSQSHAFVYFNNSILDIGTLGGSQSEALSINNLNQIVGESQNASNQPRAFLYSDGEMLDLGTLGGIKSRAKSINDNSQIVGTSNLFMGSSIQRAFLYQTNTGMVDMEVTDPIFSSDSFANDINLSGNIAGTLLRFSVVNSGYVYTNGSVNLQGSLIDTCCINDNDIFIGNDSTGISYVSDGTERNEIGPLPFGSKFSARDINNNGYIVGQLTNGGHGLAYIINPEGESAYLNSLVVNTSEFDELTAATAINENEWIAGYGRIGFSTYAFVLIPVPEIPTPEIPAPETEVNTENTENTETDPESSAVGSVNLFSIIGLFGILSITTLKRKNTYKYNSDSIV